MKTKHYFVKNLQQFVKDTEAVKKLKKYLDDIEGIFPTIEEVFGQTWDENQINIELNNLTGSPKYIYKNDTHIVKMGIYNRNIQKKYPENLWGCLFHETHHAFMRPIVYNKGNKRDFNGGFKKGEPFTRSFQQTVYFKLKDKGVINEKICNDFLNMHRKEIDSDAKDLFEEYVNMFSNDIDNFSKFINYLKLEPNKNLFTNKDNFIVDINKVKIFLLIS